MGIILLIRWMVFATICLAFVLLLNGLVIGANYFAQEHSEGWCWVGTSLCIGLSAVALGWLIRVRRVPVPEGDLAMKRILKTDKLFMTVCAVIVLIYSIGAVAYLAVQSGYWAK